jgi:hypothetical protein
MTSRAKPTRLPRSPHALDVLPNERVRKQTDADLRNGWYARHGKLSLTDDRLVFAPTKLDIGLGARRRDITLSSVTAIERDPISPGGAPRKGYRTRLLIHADGYTYEFCVPDTDAWIDALAKIYAERAEHVLAAGPRIMRTGVESLTVDER